MIVLDTNVVSALMARQRDQAVDHWLNSVPISELWIASLVIYEIKGGIDVRADGRRKRELTTALEMLTDQFFADRILSFDTAAALAAGRVGAELQRRGRPVGEVDTMLSGLCVSRNAAIATRNVSHFSNIAQLIVIDPWSAPM